MNDITLCEKCAKKDFRVLQDRSNLIFITLSQVAGALDIDEDDWEKRCAKLSRWARKEEAKKLKPNKPGRDIPRGDAEKHTKYEVIL